MKTNFEDFANKLTDQVRGQAEWISSIANSSAQEIRSSWEKQNIKPVSLHLKNGQKIDAFMTPDQRQELRRLIARGKGGLVSVREAVFVDNNLEESAEQLLVSASEIVAVGVRALRDESEAFFISLADKTSNDKPSEGGRKDATKATPKATPKATTKASPKATTKAERSKQATPKAAPKATTKAERSKQAKKSPAKGTASSNWSAPKKVLAKYPEVKNNNKPRASKPEKQADQD